MRPGNYAHERWPEYSDIIRCVKNRIQNRYYRLHTDKAGRKTTVCLTYAQARVYDNLIKNMLDDGTCQSELLPKGTSITTIEKLINKHKLFIVKDGVLTLR